MNDKLIRHYPILWGLAAWVSAQVACAPIMIPLKDASTPPDFILYTLPAALIAVFIVRHSHFKIAKSLAHGGIK